jgi:hypothetical protein
VYVNLGTWGIWELGEFGFKDKHANNADIQDRR